MLPTDPKTLGYTKGEDFLCGRTKLLQGDLEVNGQQKRDAEENGGVGERRDGIFKWARILDNQRIGL